jgi:hypothetical protein
LFVLAFAAHSTKNLFSSLSLIIVRPPSFVRRRVPLLSNARIVQGLRPPRAFAASSTDNNLSIAMPNPFNWCRLDDSSPVCFNKCTNRGTTLDNFIENVPIQFKFHRGRFGGAVWKKAKRSGYIAWTKTQPQPPVYFDPWELRKRFLNLPLSQDALLAFLNDTGIWDVTGSGEKDIREFAHWQRLIGEMMLGPKGYRNLVEIKLSEIGQVQQSWGFGHESKIQVTLSLSKLLTWEEALSDQSLSGLARQFEFPRIDVGPLGTAKREFAVAETDTTLDALLASVHLDCIRGAKFRRCARRDCPEGDRIFEVKSKHVRKYCSPYCAHLVSLRRIRAGKRRSEYGRKQHVVR